MSSILTGSTIFACSHAGGMAKPEIACSHAGGMAKPEIACSQSGGLARMEIGTLTRAISAAMRR